MAFQEPKPPIVAINDSLIDEENFYSFQNLTESCVGFASDTEVLEDLPSDDI